MEKEAWTIDTMNYYSATVKMVCGGSEMAQWLRVFTDCGEVLNSIHANTLWRRPYVKGSGTTFWHT